MREILQRILAREEPVRRFCRVQTVLPDGRYVVVDDLERKLTVDGDRGYLPGNEVIVQSGRIFGFGSRSATRKTIRV